MTKHQVKLHNRLAWSPDELCALTGMTRLCLNRAVREGVLPRPRVVGRVQRFFRVDLERHDTLPPTHQEDGSTNDKAHSLKAYKDPLS